MDALVGLADDGSGAGGGLSANQISAGVGVGGLEEIPGAEAAASPSGPDRPSEFDQTLRNVSGILQDKFPDIKIDIPGLDPGTPGSTGTNFLFFMCSLVFGMFWITYITFFNSRVVGKILTRVCARFVTEGHIRVSADTAN